MPATRTKWIRLELLIPRRLPERKDQRCRGQGIFFVIQGKEVAAGPRGGVKGPGQQNKEASM